MLKTTRLAYKDLPRTFFEIGAPKTKNLMGSMREALGTGAMKEPLDPNKLLDLRFLPVSKLDVHE